MLHKAADPKCLHVLHRYPKTQTEPFTVRLLADTVRLLNNLFWKTYHGQIPQGPALSTGSPSQSAYKHPEAAEREWAAQKRPFILMNTKLCPHKARCWCWWMESVASFTSDKLVTVCNGKVWSLVPPSQVLSSTAWKKKSKKEEEKKMTDFNLVNNNLIC